MDQLTRLQGQAFGTPPWDQQLRFRCWSFDGAFVLPRPDCAVRTAAAEGAGMT